MSEKPKICFKKEDELKKYFVLVFGVLLILAFTLEAKAELPTTTARLGISKVDFEKPQKRKLEKPLRLPGQNKDERIGVARQEKIKAYKPVLLEAAVGKDKSARSNFLKPQPFRAEGMTRLSGGRNKDSSSKTTFQRPYKITTGDMR